MPQKLTEPDRYNQLDLPFYRSEIAPILPPAVLDFHAHTWSADNWKVKPWDTGERGGQYMVTTEQYPADRLVADGGRCFPDRPYHAVCFGYPTPAVDWEKDTAFVAAAARRHNALFSLVLGGKELGIPRARYQQAIDEGGFFGFKVFLNWFGDNYGGMRIENMLGPQEMELADQRRLIVLLHVPRSGRLADPEVQAGVRRLSRKYLGAQIVLAHCGRCYLPTEMKAAIGSVRDLPNVHMDTSMVMDPVTLQMAIDAIGSERLLFGTDFPVAAMRGRRVRVMDHWVDVVLAGYPESGYRAQSSGIRATFMAWEIVLAIRWAAELTGLSTQQTQAVFFNNGMELLRRVDEGKTLRRWAEARKA